MTDAVFNFKAINRVLNRQEQKAEFEEKNPKVEPSMYGWPYGVAVPFEEPRFIPVDSWVLEEIERITGISKVKI